jgi:hypothetical protein
MSISELWRKKQMQKATSAPAPLDPPPSPSEENPRKNAIFVNEKERALQIMIYENGDDSIARGLGALEMAKDMLKSKLTEWHMRQKQRSGILVPGNGKVH